MTDEDRAVVELPRAWTETRFETGEFGPDGRSGFEATLDRPDASLSVLPVRYRRSDGRERIDALAGEFTASRDDPTAGAAAVPPTTAFATRATFAPYEREREAVVCVAADAGDALAVAVWLAGDDADAADLERNVRLHAGGGPAGSTTPTSSDDDVLGARFAGEPDRCLFTGKRTRSHRVAVPYRYAPVLADVAETDRGVVRFPSTVRSLVGVVSHGAWEDRGLADLAFDRPLERVEAGRYRLDRDVAAALDGVDAGRFGLARLGEEF